MSIPTPFQLMALSASFDSVIDLLSIPNYSRYDFLLPHSPSLFCTSLYCTCASHVLVLGCSVYGMVLLIFCRFLILISDFEYSPISYPVSFSAKRVRVSARRRCRVIADIY